MSDSSWQEQATKQNNKKKQTLYNKKNYETDNHQTIEIQITSTIIKMTELVK